MSSFFCIILSAFRHLNSYLILICSHILHVDETPIKLRHKKHWIHTLSNNAWSLQYVHQKRGFVAIESLGVLQHFTGTLIHDHWQAYYMLKQCKHSLCNAHHARELTRAYEQDHHAWAEQMRILLSNINIRTKEHGGCLPSVVQEQVKEQYRNILHNAEQACPETLPKNPSSKRRPAQTKARNLLERLRDHEDDTLRFMTDPLVDFTNNTAERSIRMSKVKEKISGIYRAVDGADAYCSNRSYTLTCSAHGIDAYAALQLLAQNKYPEFIQKQFAHYGGAAKVNSYLTMIKDEGISALEKIPKPPPPE